MVAIFARYQGTDVTPVKDKVYKMIQNSDNNPASSILDELTGTDSGKPLSSRTIEAWVAKRKSVNKIFTNAGYPDLNISQKNFPIPDLELKEPEGRDMQMRGDPQFPERNYLTTYSVARLLLEIEQGKAVSSLSSEKMKSLLKRDYTREKSREYDAIKGFLGEGLDPEKILLYSKVGWTNESRQDAAIIISRDGKTRYILVVFGNDASFANDETVFPDIAKMVYAKMRL
jgi:beta-lactamase class A